MKRIIYTLLGIMLTTGVWAENVAKIGETEYATLQGAFDAATTGQTVQLIADVKLAEWLNVNSGKDVTLDLNDHTIAPTDDRVKTNYCIILVHRGAKLTVDDSSVGKTGCIDGGTGDHAYYGGILLTKNDDPGSEPATLVVNNGKIKGEYAAISGNGTRHNTNVTINGGTFIATDNEGTAIYHPQDGSLTITGGSFTGVASAVELRSGTLNISGGSFTATASSYSCTANGNGITTIGAALAIAQHTTKKDISVNISGGTFSGVKAVSEANPQGNTSPAVTMAINNGTFTGDITATDVNNFVSGGTFTSAVADGYCAPGFEVVLDAEGHYVAKAETAVEAKIGETKYATLAAALAAATEGQTVTLLADINEAIVNTNENNFTIDLNGKNWISSGDAFKNNGGTVTFTGDGLVKSTATDGIAVWARTGSIIINSGNYENCSNEEATVYVGTTNDNLGGKQPTITINDGSFKNTADGVYKWNTNLKPLTLNIINNIADANTYQAIVIKGGNFYGNDPSIGDDSQLNKITNNSNFVSPELHATMENGKFIIEEGEYVAQVGYLKYVTVAEAAAVGDDITLLADATIETINVVSGKTLKKNGHELTVTNFTVTDGVAATIPFDFTATTATYTRTMPAGTKWGTVCVPFTLTQGDGTSAPKLYTFGNIDGATLTVNEVAADATVAPGTPVVFSITGPAVFTTSNATVSPTAPAETGNLVGTYSSKKIETGLSSIYYINGDAFHQAKASLTVPAYRAYVNYTTVPLGAKPSVLSLFVDDDMNATCVGAVMEEMATAKNICDILGRQFSAPKKGINIMKLADGKIIKVIIK
ncbi:MAG: hypothetical protein KBT34_08420 [Prevotella sp.]|nr:hypothetical protein [Candidatus Prevotella equi]